MQNKLIKLAVMIAAFLAVGAYAQQSKVVGVQTAERVPVELGEARTLLLPVAVVHIGKIPPTNMKLKTAGTAPLKSALRQLTPEGWSMWTTGRIEAMPQTITWNAGRDWFLAISDALIKYDIGTTINWNDKSVTLSGSAIPKPMVDAPGQKAAPSVAVDKAVIATQSAVQKVQEDAKQASLNASTVAKVVTEQPMQEWEVTASDVSIKSLMARWAAVAKYQVSHDDLKQNYGFLGTAKIIADFPDAVCGLLEGMNETIKERNPSGMIEAAFYPLNRSVRLFELRDSDKINAPETCATRNAERDAEDSAAALKTQAPAPTAKRISMANAGSAAK
jgi:hypothetical protein